MHGSFRLTPVSLCVYRRLYRSVVAVAVAPAKSRPCLVWAVALRGAITTSNG